jgi:mRNA interferase RelE/StbE
MAYSVHLSRRADKQLDELPSVVRSDVMAALVRLAETPRPHGCKWIGELESWRVRVGDYRILYIVDDSASEVTVYRIQDRKDVYRRR